MDSQTPHPHPHDQLLPALEKAASRASSSPPQRTDEAQAQAVHPSPADQRSGRQEKAGGDTASVHPQTPLGRKDPKEATVTPPPVAPILCRVSHPRRRPVSRERQVVALGDAGPKAQDPESWGLTSPKTRVPSAGEAGNGHGGGWGTWSTRGAPPPPQARKVTSTPHLSSSSACPCIQR